MLCTNPEKRISSRDIVLTLKNWGKINKIELPDEVLNIKKRQNGEIDLLNGQNFIGDDEIKKVQEKIKNKEVGVIGNNKNLLWDFNVDDSNNNNIKSKNNNSNNNDKNILDFEFMDSPKQIKNEKKNNNENIFNFFQNDNNNTSNNNNNNNKDLFEFETNNNEINKNVNNSNNINNSSNQNYDYGFHFDNNKQQTISFNQMEEKKSEGNFHKQNTQDILSFFQ